VRAAGPSSALRYCQECQRRTLTARPGTAILRARAGLLAFSETLTEHAAYFDEVAPGYENSRLYPTGHMSAFRWQPPGSGNGREGLEAAHSALPRVPAKVFY
jgi:hypothetical protein